MKKATLMTIADIVNTVDNSNKELFEILELLNLTDGENEMVVDAIMVVAEKIAQLKQSSINNLDDYIDVSYIETTYRY